MARTAYSFGNVRMSRKSLLLAVGLLVLLLGGGVAAGYLLVRHEPDFYRNSAAGAGPERQQMSNQFQTEFWHFVETVINNEPEWQHEFTEVKINSFFDEDFRRAGSVEKNLPEGISGPRVAFRPDRIRLAFRYGKGFWSTVVSADLRIGLAARGPNVMVIEILGLRAGALPISAQAFMDRVSEAVRRYDIDVLWYRHNGNPVALLSFQAGRRYPTVQLRQLELHQGRIVIRGRSVDEPPARPATPAIPSSEH